MRKKRLSFAQEKADLYEGKSFSLWQVAAKAFRANRAVCSDKSRVIIQFREGIL